VYRVVVSDPEDAIVTVVDDDEDLRDAVLGLVTMLMHGPGLALPGLAGMIANEAAVLHSKLVILDINLGPGKPSGVEAFRWLKSRSFGGHIVFLTGHARSQPLVVEACAVGEAKVYQKPIGIADLRAIVREAS
jgi:FixJ family two-component response regulator